MDNINVKRIKVDSKGLFTYWLTFLKPYHNLRQKEIEALSVFLYYRHKLSEEVLNKSLIDKLLFSPDVRKNIMEELGISSTYIFNNLLSALRKKGVISKDNKIAEVLIPNFTQDSDNFKLVFNFEINDRK
jgi:hypothetical protein